MTTVYVEDNAIKKVVIYIMKKFLINYPVRIPNKTDSAGWTEVLKSVSCGKKEKDMYLGIIEKDIENKAKEYSEWESIKDRIFITEKKEVESYFYNKKELDDFKKHLENIDQKNFNTFKKEINTNETLLNRVSFILAKCDCPEIERLQQFFKKNSL